MRFLGRLKRSRKGVGSIVGAVFVVLILLSGFTFYATYLSTSDHYNATAGSMDNLSWNQNQEKIVIKQISITAANNLNLTVENQGTVHSHLIWLGIFNKTATPESQGYYALDESLNPSETQTIISNFTVVQGLKYIVQLVTELGNTVQNRFYPASGTQLAISLTAASPTTYTGNNVTVMMAVTLNDTEIDTIQNITASISAAPTGLVQLVDNSPLTVKGLARGESAFFWWIYNTIGTGTVTFNATYSSAPAGTYALTNVTILAAPGQGVGGNISITGVDGTAEYNPSQWNPFGATMNTSGSVADLTSNDSSYAVFSSYYTGTGTDINHFVDNNASNVDNFTNVGTGSNFTALQYGPDSIYDTLTEQSTGNYGGLSLVTATGSIPNDMDKDTLGYMAAVFFNPTGNVFQVTRVEFNASSAINQVFNSVDQGPGKSYPTSGWVNDGGKKVSYWTGTLTIQPHTSQGFFVRIGANNKAEAFNVNVRITANSSVYSNLYACEQLSTDGPWSFLRLGNGVTPEFTETTAPNMEQTFYVALEEDANKPIGIASGGTLRILVPPEFSNLRSVGGTGWGSATITNNQIQVSNTQIVKNGYIYYGFNATAPSYPGLYKLNVSFNGTPNTQIPMGNFSIQVTGTTSYKLDLEFQWSNVEYTQTNRFLCIYGGTMATENLDVDVWNGSGWNTLFTNVASGWNNVSVSSYLTSSNFTIRFRDDNASDISQDSWNVDVALLHLWTVADQQTAEVEFTGSSNLQNWTSLFWQIQSCWNVTQVTVTIQFYNFTLGNYSSSGNGYFSYMSSSTANTNELQSKTENSNPSDFKNSTGQWRVRITGVKSASTPFLMKIDWIDLQTTYSTTDDTTLYNAWQLYSIKATTTSGNPIPYASVSIYANGTNIVFRNATDETPIGNPTPMGARLDASGTIQLEVKSSSGSSETFVLYAVVGSLVGQKTVTQEAP